MGLAVAALNQSRRVARAMPLVEDAINRAGKPLDACQIADELRDAEPRFCIVYDAITRLHDEGVLKLVGHRPGGAIRIWAIDREGAPA